MKYFASVVLSVFLSVSAMLAAVHYTPSTDTSGFTALRQATYRIDIGYTGVGVVGSCSGTFIDEHIMLTAAHCDPFQDTIFTVGGQKAFIVKKDAQKDLMLLMVPTKHTYIEVGKVTPALNSKVVAVGYPFGLAQYLTEGRVQGDVTLPEEMKMMENPPKFLTVSSMVSPGNSGGGIFYKDFYGHYTLVGVVSRGGGTVTLAVHLDEIQAFI